MKRKMLLISNSTNYGEEYLGWPRTHIKEFLQSTEAKEVLFIPHAGVNLSTESIHASYDVYEKRVAAVYESLGYKLRSIHTFDDPIAAVEQAEAIAVGGGNTFHLVYMMHKTAIMEPIRKRVLEGMPYMGWSAGSNVACPSLRTTNDMPIIEPASFNGLNLIPFQINPHYLDANPEGHGGETREQRILEFTTVNRDLYVVGLREACLLHIENNQLKLVGSRPLRIFKYGQDIVELDGNSDLQFLM
ncbi:MAG: dipeptidase PepE [Bacteroidetes bacterium]|nr:MAG: dipeptidase PepE [Bacteroidota bacterium]